MRLSSFSISVVVVLSLLALQGCDRASDTSSLEPAGPELSARSAGCDFGRMSQDARSYFPGNGRGSISADVQDLIDDMEDACAVADTSAYTYAWFQVAGIIEQVLAEGTGGDSADLVSFLNQSISVLGPDEKAIFDPCDGLANCQSWDGADDGILPPFAEVLEFPEGAWAVVGDETEGGDTVSVCSSFASPCDVWMMGDDETWGVEPATTWGDALWDRPSLLFGFPIGHGGPTSPTGEATFGGMSAYDWLLIPHPEDFGSDTGDGELLVSFCANADATVGQQLMMQKASTILTESEDSSWCTLDTGPVGEASFLQSVASFLSPLPAPLNATLLARGPGAGGLAGSFTDFYGVDIPTEAVIAIPVQPADGTVDQPITDRDGNPFRVLTYTSTESNGTPLKTPLEKAMVKMEVIGNAGLVPSDNEVSATTLTCSDFTCTGETQSDEEDDPGTLLLPLEFTKTGQYSLCFTAKLAPLQFSERVCTEKFNIRP